MRLPSSVPPSIRKQACSHIKLASKQIANYAFYHMAKKGRKHDLKSCVLSPNHAPAESQVLGCSFVNGGETVAISSDALLRNAIDRERCVDGFVAIDGWSNVRGYTVLRVGVLDKCHTYHDVAFRIISQDENEERARRFLEIVDDHIKNKLGHPQGLNIKVAMLDGSIALRKAVSSFTNEKCLLGMCFAHVLRGCKKKNSKSFFLVVLVALI